MQKLLRPFLKVHSLQNKTGVQKIGHSFVGYWLIGRDVSIYRHADFSKLPKNKRQGALTQQMKLWSPFSDTGYYTIWNAGKVYVWLWDRELQHQRASDYLGGAVSSSVCIPEFLMQPKFDHALVMKQVSVGYELQAWHDGYLIASSWSANSPTVLQKTQFLAQLPNEMRSLDWQSQALGFWLEKPWMRVPKAQFQPQQIEKKFIAIGLLILSTILVFEATRLVDLMIENQQLVDQREHLSQQIAPTLELRQQFLSVRQANSQMIAHLKNTDQVALMLAVRNALGDLPYTLLNWNFAKDSVEIEFLNRNGSAQLYVQKLEESEEFYRVSSQPTRQKDAIKIVAKVAQED